MISLVLRIAGWLFALFSVGIMATLGLRLFEERGVEIPWGEAWYNLDAGSLNLAQTLVQRYASPDFWDNQIVPLLQRPVWQGMCGSALVLLMLAIVFMVAGRRRRRRRSFG